MIPIIFDGYHGLVPSNLEVSLVEQEEVERDIPSNPISSSVALNDIGQYAAAYTIGPDDQLKCPVALAEPHTKYS
jgi:hypothetical protein